MVGRPRQFDEAVVLDAAMQTFWSKGYESTSLADLMAATGLHKGSIYQAFGDKHQFFLAALRRYLEGMRQQKRDMLKAGDSPLQGFRNLTHYMLDLASGDEDCKKGCMAINAVVELAPHDPEVEQVLAEHHRLMRESVIEQMRAAQDAGQVPSHKDPELLADMMMTFMAGLATTMKGPLGGDQAHALLDAQINAALVQP